MDLVKLIGSSMIGGLAWGIAVAGNSWAADAPRFKGSADLPDAVQIATGFSDDGQAVTVLFRNLDVVVDGRAGAPIDTRTASVALPIANNGQDVSVTQDVRGFVQVEDGVRAAVVVHAAGKTTVVDLDQAKRKCDDAHDSDASREAAKQAREQAEKQQSEDDATERTQGSDFETRLQGTVPAGGSYHVSFWLVVENGGRDSEAGGLLVVDSLDVVISPDSANGQAQQ